MPILLPGKSGGFTLFEIIVVLVILGAATAIVAPSFVGGLSGIQMETTTRDLITCMRRARSDAVAQQKTFRIVLKANPDGKSRYILADEFQKPIKSYELPQGITFADSENWDQDKIFSFYANGRSSGGEVLIRNKSGRKILVELDPITGFGKMARKLGEGGRR